MKLNSKITEMLLELSELEIHMNDELYEEQKIASDEYLIEPYRTKKFVQARETIVAVLPEGRRSWFAKIANLDVGDWPKKTNNTVRTHYISEDAFLDLLPANGLIQ